MKKSIFAFLLLSFVFAMPTQSDAQNRPLNKFYRKYKRGNDVQNIKLPGWLIRVGGKIAIKGEEMEKEDTELAKQLVKKIGSAKFMYSEDGAKIPKKAVEKLKRDLQKHDFYDLFMIRTGEETFDLMIEESGGEIKSLFMMYNSSDDGEMAFITLKTKLTMDELKELLNESMKENYQKIIEEDNDEPIVVPLL